MGDLIFAIDPGNVHSAYVLLDADTETLVEFGKVENDELRNVIIYSEMPNAVFAIETIASFGMAVGATVFETCFWTGRFIELIYHNWGHIPAKVYRKDVKMHLCHSMRAKDGNIRQALIDRLGEPGTKKNPGKTYGVSADVWAALAVAIYAKDTLYNA